MYWEFGGGASVADVNVGTAAEWAARHPWAAPRRDEILRRIGEELVRRKAPGCAAVVNDNGWMSLVPRSGSAPAGVPRGSGVPGVTTRPAGAAPKPTPAEQYFRFSAARARIVGILGVVIVVLAVLFGMVRSVFQVRTIGTPIASSVRSGPTVLTLISRLEPYVPSLHRDPSKDRYTLGLLVDRLDNGQRTYVEVGKHREAKLDGVAYIRAVEGNRAWIETPETVVYDLGSGRLTPAAEVERDPSLAPPRKAFSMSDLARGDDATRLFMASGGRVAGNRWMGALSEEEAARACREGSRVPMVSPFARSLSARGVYAADIAGEGTSATFVSYRPNGPDSLKNPFFLRAARDGELFVTDAGGLLLMYETSRLPDGRMILEHLLPDGTIAWSTDTGIHAFRDILPDPATPAFVGTRPPADNQVPEPILVVIDVRTGAATTRSLLMGP